MIFGPAWNVWVWGSFHGCSCCVARFLQSPAQVVQAEYSKLNDEVMCVMNFLNPSCGAPDSFEFLAACQCQPQGWGSGSSVQSGTPVRLGLVSGGER